MSAVFGIILNKNCWEELEEGAPILQHRGDEWSGISLLVGNRILVIPPEKGKIKPLLEKEGPKIKETQMAIAALNQKNPQPVTIEETKIGPISLAFDGKIINREELQQMSPYLVGTDAEILARIVAEGKDPLDGIKKIYQRVKGPFSLVLLTLEGIFVARDILGIRPLAFARFLGDEKVGCAVASESIALEHIGMKLIREVRPGEIGMVEVTGFRTLERISSPDLVICGFEYGYWARPSSIIEDIPVGLAKYNAGMKLAPSCPEVDFIAGLPMSGNTAAEGLAYALKTPYRSVFDYNIEAGGRSFIPLSTEERDKRARRKLLIMSWAVKGKRVLIVDDSIVEGRQTLARIFLVKNARAEEVHLRIETPRMKYRCPFDVTPRGELLAATHSDEGMRQILGVKTLDFNKVEDYAEAVVLAQDEERKEKNPVKIENICLGCFTGEFPQYK